MKSYEGKISTIFHGYRIPKKGPQCICLSVRLLGSVSRTDKNNYSQAFSRECKYVIKENKMP